MTTVVIGMAGVAVGMMDSTFKHYYRKYADYEDMKNHGVQEVTLLAKWRWKNDSTMLFGVGAAIRLRSSSTAELLLVRATASVESTVASFVKPWTRLNRPWLTR